MYDIFFTKSAEKTLNKLPKETRIRIAGALKRLRFRPEQFLTKLVGVNHYKFRVGDYRLIIDLDKGKLIVLVLKVGHRKNIYTNV